MYPSHCQRVIKIHLKKKKRILPSSIAITIHHWGGKKVSAIIRFADTRQKEERKWQQSEKESEGRKENGERGQVEEAERLATGEGGRANEGRGEGFITKDLLLLPGGGEALERRAALHTCAGCVYPMHGPLCIYTCIYMYIRVARIYTVACM